MENNLQILPAGIQCFEDIRLYNNIYVDKTKYLLKLIQSGRRYFLSRPRRFGKSLTISTFEAMFQGKAELFHGLEAEQWVKEQKDHKNFVLHLDLSALNDFDNEKELNDTLIDYLDEIVFDNNLNIEKVDNPSRYLKKIIREAYARFGKIVVLIDEYDKPILDNITYPEKIIYIRSLLHSFYSTLKACDKYIYFLFITGISRFTKLGVFSSINNLIDISFSYDYSAIVGYTQDELEYYFRDWLKHSANEMHLPIDVLVSNIKEYYDGFCFDGEMRVYNPFSILNFLHTKNFKNFWFSSGSPSFIIHLMEKYCIQHPDEYRHIQVDLDFTDLCEIENASPASFLYQSGYLTIEKRDGNILTLDYPNKEIIVSISKMYLRDIYKIKDYIKIGKSIWDALEKEDFQSIIACYNAFLAELPCDGLGNRNECWYRAFFLLLLRCAGSIGSAEVHALQGRSDIAVQLDKHTIVIEFKLAENAQAVDRKRQEGIGQIKELGCAKARGGTRATSRKLAATVIVVNDALRQATLEGAGLSRLQAGSPTGCRQERQDEAGTFW